MFEEEEGGGGGGGGGGSFYRIQKGRKSHIKPMWDSYLTKEKNKSRP